MTTYDYIVVGGGSAGAVVASRLSEDPETSVLLLEAGVDWRSEDADEAMRDQNFLRLVAEGRFVWPGLTGRLTDEQEPEPYLVGRGLGGGSTVNAQFWARPPLDDFDGWADRGCDGWDGATMRPYLDACEADADFGDRPYHGDDGPIPVWHPREDRGEWGSVDRAFRDAAVAHGHPFADDVGGDVNAPGRTGICAGAYNVDDGERVTTNDAYLEPARDRDTLTIRCERTVDVVRFDGRRATGVDAIGPAGRERYDADAVVLCAGAIYTPAILLRSGIGPAAQLADLDVAVRSDRPGLGRLIDHPQLSIVFPLEERYRADEATGPAASVVTFWSSETEYGRENDLHALSQNYRGVGSDATNTGGLLLGLTHVYSRGTVTVPDADPRSHPTIEARMLSDRRDLERVRDAVEHLADLCRSDELGRVMAGEPAIADHSGENYPLGDLDADSLERAILERIDSYDHPVGTCRMGDADDPDAVVDPGCGVLGVDDLYVVDASIMPDIVRVQTNYATIAMAERAVDLLVD